VPIKGEWRWRKRRRRRSKRKRKMRRDYRDDGETQGQERKKGRRIPRERSIGVLRSFESR